MNENWTSAHAIQITNIHFGQAFTGLSNTTGNTATAISLTAMEGTKKNAFSIASWHLAHVSLLVRDAEGKMTDRNAVIAVGMDAKFTRGRYAPDKNNAE